MFKAIISVDSYADFKTVVSSLGEPSSVFYRFTSMGASIQIWAISSGVAVGSSGINSDPPTEPDLLTDFPSAHAMTASFSVSV